jgi:lipopolysaccharide heptosyltransferase II
LNRVLIIQTAFIGDVILATGLIESLKEKHPFAKIDFLLRKGNEGILTDHPHINELIIWDKSNKKYRHLRKIGRQIRKTNYDLVLNLQRFASSGYLTWNSRSKIKVGFTKNPLAFSFTHKVKHLIGENKHEIERNHELLAVLGDYKLHKPKLYPSVKSYEKVQAIFGNRPYLVMAPASVWFTKQLPKDKWLELIRNQDPSFKIYLIGGKSDEAYLEDILIDSKNEAVVNLAGKLNLLDSAALISGANMTYVNDSAPLHLASAMDAPVTAFFCSTIPSFGFGPLSTSRKIVETPEKLDCRPCGLHGKRTCPLGHFKCGTSINVTI